MMVHHEPRLNDLLEDPVVRLVMERDGVYRDDVLNMMRAVARKAAPAKAAVPKTAAPEPALGHA
ncbi:hypothetical protein [Nitrospirillum iridis]|uniref:Uncharacterized protein n=1 Tax=Nitrospirillum iridis TaxID=765888 RepID=A0A7X0B1G6_9PROT|nr:hypothetical protein [Nitrospirillum iridis]MBB6252636.1 hypothetical protein [Nitrospirillum iridis]